jgi:hypothetical protein
LVLKLKTRIVPLENFLFSLLGTTEVPGIGLNIHCLATRRIDQCNNNSSSNDDVQRQQQLVQQQTTTACPATDDDDVLLSIRGVQLGWWCVPMPAPVDNPACSRGAGFGPGLLERTRTRTRASDGFWRGRSANATSRTSGTCQMMWPIRVATTWCTALHGLPHVVVAAIVI